MKKKIVRVNALSHLWENKINHKRAIIFSMKNIKFITEEIWNAKIYVLNFWFFKYFLAIIMRKSYFKHSNILARGVGTIRTSTSQYWLLSVFEMKIDDVRGTFLVLWWVPQDEPNKLKGIIPMSWPHKYFRIKLRGPAAKH